MADEPVSHQESVRKSRPCKECGTPVYSKAGPAICKLCAEAKRKTYLSAYMADYRVENATQISAKHKEWLARNAETEKPKNVERTKRWIAENPERHKENQARNYAANREQRIASTRQNRDLRREEDLDAYRAKEAAYMRKRREDEKILINGRMSNRIWCALKARGGRKRPGWIKYVGYNVDELRDRLFETLPAGYAWADFLSGVLEIDHIRPVASFDFTCEDDPGFRECWALSNLRLLPADQNRSKGAKLDWTSPIKDAAD